jgi:hypothetical protein
MKAVFRDDLVNSKHITLTKSCEFMTFTTKFRLMLYNLYKPLL